MEGIKRVPSPFRTKMFLRASLKKGINICIPQPYLVMKIIVLREPPEFALQVNNTSFLPDHLNSEFIISLLQLSNLLPVFIFLNETMRILCLSLIA